jgi:hypothetical protein
MNCQTLTEIMDYHMLKCRAFRKERIRRIECSLGPPLTTEHERKHKRWADELKAIIKKENPCS